MAESEKFFNGVLIISAADNMALDEVASAWPFRLKQIVFQEAASKLFVGIAKELTKPEATRIFQEAAKRAANIRKGPHKPHLDQDLLHLLDCKAVPGGIPGLARQLDKTQPGYFGLSAGAIEKKLRRLVQKRGF